jgi:branched-chain amino acid transport system permease protein
MDAKMRFDWISALKVGLVGGVLALVVSLVGMVRTFDARDIISGVISMGRVLILLTMFISGYFAARRSVPVGRPASPVHTILAAALAGLTTSLILLALVLFGRAVDMRDMFIEGTPALFQALTFGLEGATGYVVLLLAGLIVGVVAALIYLLPNHMRKAIITALMWVLLIGLLTDLLRLILATSAAGTSIIQLLFGPRGLSVRGAAILFILIALVQYFWAQRGSDVRAAVRRLPRAQQRGLRGVSMVLAILLLLALPIVLGTYPSEVLDNVGLYILLGLGLNIVVGFAGLLDLGYVAFYAIGAYTVGVLTSPEIATIRLALGLPQMTFWGALPFAIVIAMLFGIILGIPVLKTRGDYLAIITLGFGEIIRILAQSDWLRPSFGGSQGIILIPQAIGSQVQVGGTALADQQKLYYLILAGCLVVAFVAWRLKDSRLGRAWMALREDEDVAEAMGINLVATKLLAFAAGASFSGLSGAIFASKLGSIYPHSFQLLVSINILAIVIIGGMGSIPGAIVGALALVGLPELLREFAEYRLLVYGAVLVLMMLVRPEGLWPEATRQRELHEPETGVEAETVRAPMPQAEAVGSE